MRKPTNLHCSCGAVIGEQVFSHIDPRMRGFGQPSDEVYKNVYNGKEVCDIQRSKACYQIPQGCLGE